MKRKANDTDGIWQEVRYQPETNDEFLSLFDKLNPRSAVDFMAPLISNTIQVLENSDAPEESKEDAENVMFYYEQLKEYLETLLRDADVSLLHHVHQAVIFAIHLGRFYEVMCVRPCEPKVVHATKARRGLDSGRKEKAIKTADRRKEIADAVKKRMKTHPKDSLTYARKIVTNEMNIAFNTVRNATAGMKRPRKKTKK